MNSPKLYHQLTNALRQGNTGSIFNWLPEVPDENVRAALHTVISTDHETYLIIKKLLQTQYPPRLALRHFFDRQGEAHPGRFFCFSAQGCAPTSVANACKTAVEAAIMARLYAAVTYLCSYALDQGAEFIQVGLSSVEGEVMLTIDADVSFFSCMEEAEDVALCMAQNHIRRINGVLSVEGMGVNARLSRLTLSVDVQ
ncbi:hypothetical protein FNH22_23745 [Fulvivirga sp. M361]|uniref:hypothetical protein n=1 Tax=Fulvivirga sp. M361 TaxID=2594266 RepID=UPI001179C632|nr:hypothetical protein [Fulvivirga sp. M361]TRX51582.1 hypothetical protein FNH22_23745 [Fulvivirga sp. M361]